MMQVENPPTYNIVDDRTRAFKKGARLRFFNDTDGCMKILLFVSMLLPFFSLPTCAQGSRQTFASKRPPVLIDKKKPSVYITFVRFSLVRIKSEGDRSLIWLKLRNNTRWPISLEMSGGRTEDPNEASLYYQTLDKNDEVIENRGCHVCSVNNVGPNRYILFAVPSDSLPKDSRLRIRFSYGWESFENQLLDQEPEHFVSFSFSEVPLSSVGNSGFHAASNVRACGNADRPLTQAVLTRDAGGSDRQS